MKPFIRRKWILLCLCAIFPFGATGCWDSQMIEQRTFVAAMALDVAKGGYEATIQAPVPAKIVGGGGEGGGGGGKGGPEAVQLFSGKGKSLAEAILDLQSRVNYPLFFGHTQIILLSEEVARRGIDDVLDYMRRHPEFRRRLWPVVVKGKAIEGLMIKTRLEQIPTYYLRDMIETNVKAGRVPDQTLNDVYINISTPYREVSLLNVVTGEESDYDMKGLAVLKKGRMVGVVPHPMSNPLLQIREQKRGWNMAVPCPDGQGKVLFRPTWVQRKIEVSDEPAVRIHVDVEGNLIEKTCGIDLSQQKAVKSLERRLAEAYEKTARDLVEQTYRRMKVDVFQLGNYIHAFEPDLYRKIDWKNNFSSIPVTVDYDVQIRRMGLESR
jgi:spore germination protein KC